MRAWGGRAAGIFKFKTIGGARLPEHRYTENKQRKGGHRKGIEPTNRQPATKECNIFIA